MKIEPTRDLQSNRIDHRKANKTRHVRSLPSTGREGDVLCVGEIPEGGYRGDGLYMFLLGEWRFMGPVVESD